ncbi:putative bifunctional diguanylate cyclase/phosphodiesterase [Vibrio viridaestus]|uniref:Phosphodiesterase n=1 Tax=Vibrio viridaestus TaxID=2487322 RepID=A0A3N9U9J7_9VIBR|nr:GGDEF domain-containing phosphodiesterase [Vibrio viridaestus]RQW64906.1 phosphodiesterase [Vibrio viridaestus]
MNSKSRLTSMAAIKQVTNLIHDMTDDDVYSRAVALIHELFSTSLTTVITLDHRGHCSHIRAISSVFPTNYYLLDELQPIISRHFNSHRKQDHIIPQGISAQFPDSHVLTNNQIEGYVGTTILTDKGEVLGVLISLTKDTITEPDDILDWHNFASQLIIKHAFCLRCQSKTEGLFQKLNYEVSHDNLTGMMNRSYLADTLERLVSVSQTNLQFTLVLLDIDNFKSINDIYGNYIGDQVLKSIAVAIKSIITDEKLSFRIAADEFAFITFNEEPIKVCETILNTISRGYSNSSLFIKLSARVGLATQLEQQLEADQLILNASLALKEGKNSSRKISCFNTLLLDQYHRRTLVIEELKNELNKESKSDSELFVVFQPIVHRDRQDWDCFEVLTRWQNARLGTVSPAEFIASAEQSGLMIELGKHILHKACEAKALVEEKIGRPIHLSINCSAQELNQSQNYFETFTNMIREWGFSPCDFTIEITETALLTNNQMVNDILHQLRDAGFKIALDDFGTGYSSLNYVHSYPVDCIKIDASFVKNMLINPTSEKIVKLIIQLAEQLEFDLVAEGVEDNTALERLHAMGCQRIQGYFYSKPLHPTAMIKRLSDNPAKD